MRVNCNLSSIIANTKLKGAQSSLDRAIERLSSGLKINSAEDDAAGLAIANKLHTQIKGLDRSNKNVADGISVVETAESALNETQSLIQRMRELAVQAASDTNGVDDRKAIQQEIDALLDEVTRISSATEFNSMPLLDGTLNRRCYSNVDDISMFSVSSSVPAGDYTLVLEQDATQASANVTINQNAFPAEGKVEINGSVMDITEEDTYDTVLTKFTELCDNANLLYDKTTGVLNTYEYGITETIECKISDSLSGIFDVSGITAGTDAVVSFGTDNNGGFNNTATISTNGNFVTITDFGGFELTLEFESTLVADNGGPVEFTEKVTDMGCLTVQLGANEGQTLDIDIPVVDQHTLGIENLNVCTALGASEAITKLDIALEKVSAVRSQLGAYQNRLEGVVTHLEAYEENVTAAVSRVEDADMAEEMTEYTSQNVITQAATSILGQANERPQTVLQLLSR